MKYICSKCKCEEPVTTEKSQCDCGGLFQLSYDLPDFDLEKVDRSVWGLYRYHEFLPLSGDYWKEYSMGEGMTPIISLDDSVLLKMDYMMPTLSFKDRGAAVLIDHCHSIGVDRVVQDSSGNAGNSVAAYCARAGIACDIYVPEGTSPMKIAMIQSHGAQIHIIPGSREDCANACRSRARKEHIFYANHVYNPFFYEGTKTYIYEVYEQLHRIPEHLFIPLGNGTLFIGVVKGLEHLLKSGIIDKMPHLAAVQSEHCAPFSDAVRKHASDISAVHTQPTLAEGIAIAKPMRAPEILSAIYKYNIDVITAPEDLILSSQKILAEKGIFCELTTAATYAAYLHYCELYGPLKDVLLPMCGAGLKSVH